MKVLRGRGGEEKGVGKVDGKEMGEEEDKRNIRRLDFNFSVFELIG